MNYGNKITILINNNEKTIMVITKSIHMILAILTLVNIIVK